MAAAGSKCWMRPQYEGDEPRHRSESRGNLSDPTFRSFGLRPDGPQPEQRFTDVIQADRKPSFLNICPEAPFWHRGKARPLGQPEVYADPQAKDRFSKKNSRIREHRSRV